VLFAKNHIFDPTTFFGPPKFVGCQRNLLANLPSKSKHHIPLFTNKNANMELHPYIVFSSSL